MTHNADRKKAARSLASALRCTYQQALDVLDDFPPDVRVEFPDGRATVIGRVVRCDLGPSIMTLRVWCELCPWEAGIDPFKFALEAALAHDAACPGTPDHLELIGPRTWRRIPDAELDQRAASKPTPLPAVAVVDRDRARMVGRAEADPSSSRTRENPVDCGQRA